MDIRSFRATLMLAVLLTSITAPTVAGEWSDDTWLENIIGPERLENGDEFGCHGYEDISATDENWVIEACKDYLMQMTNASRWGIAPTVSYTHLTLPTKA